MTARPLHGRARPHGGTAIVTALALFLGVAATSGARETTGSAVTWQVVTLPPTASGPPASFGEPGIALGSHRRLVVNAARANDGYPTWWVSRDGGDHWGPGRDFDASGAMTGDADAAVGADGRLYVLNLAFKQPPDQPTNPTILVYSSADWRSWSDPAAFPAPHGADQPDRPWLFTDPDHASRVYVTNSEGAGDVVLWTSSDHARSFSGPTLVTGPDHAASIELTSRPLFDPRDHERIYMLYAASSWADAAVPGPAAPLRDFPLTQLWLATSEDRGRSWSNNLVLDITSAFGPAGRGGSIAHVLPALAADTAGTLYAAFSLRLAGSTETHVYVMHSADGGASWSDPAPIGVEEPGRSNVMPALAAGAPGRLDVSWYGSPSRDFTDPGARWVEMFAQSLNALATSPTFATSQVSGVTHVGSIDSSGNPGSSQYDWGLRDFQSLAVDTCGMAHVAWTNDVGHGATLTARQTSGASLLPRSRC
jgi:hypothetical protein